MKYVGRIQYLQACVCFRSGNSIALNLKEIRSIIEVRHLTKCDSISLLNVLKLD
jgi:hypothetical protein